MKFYSVITLFFIYVSQGFAQNANINSIPSSTVCPDFLSGQTLNEWGFFYGNIGTLNYNQSQLLSENPNASFQLGNNTTTAIAETSTSNRFELINQSSFQDFIQNSFSGVTFLEGITNTFLKIGGNPNIGGGRECAVKKINLTRLTSSNEHEIAHSGFSTNIYVMLRKSNLNSSPPYFRINIKVLYNDGVYANLPSDVSNKYIFSNSICNDDEYNLCLNSNDFVLKRYRLNVNFLNYVDYCRDPIAIISYEISDGGTSAVNENSAVAFISNSCTQYVNSQPLTYDGKNICKGETYSLQLPYLFANEPNSSDTVKILVKDEYTGSTTTLPQGTTTVVFPDSHPYVLIYQIFKSNCIIQVISTRINVVDCTSINCIDCTSFDLELGKKYSISGWVNVMQEISEDRYKKVPDLTSYESAHIKVTFLNISNTAISTPLIFSASGNIIDGWQRIYGEFIVPEQIDDIKIDLINNYPQLVTFFDDIRVHPFDGNMKSFVYDQGTQKLMAELDENNYATFYEYDKEGGLVRVKKETEKGTYTIQETRSSTKKP